MSLTYEEFIDDEITPPLKIGKIQSSVSMHDWPLSKKLAYLKERKEILYGIWSLEPNGNRFAKNFYRAFANEARVLLLSEHKYMSKLKEFQNEIYKEVEQTFYTPKLLNYAYHKHEAEITMIKYHPESYIKSRVLDYKNLYTDDRVGSNRLYGLFASLQSEIWLLYQRTYVENWSIYMRYFDDQIRNTDLNILKMQHFNKDFDKVEPTEALKSDIALLDSKSTKTPQQYSLLFSLYNKKSEKRFNYVAKDENTKFTYYDEYRKMEAKVCFWVSLYKFPWIKFHKHYKSFRSAIDTEISLNAQTEKLPKELYDLIRELVDYKFEKVEFVKNFLPPIEDKEVQIARADPITHLVNWNNEILELMKDNVYSDAELENIKNMCYLRAICLLSRKQAKEKFDTDYFASSVYKANTIEKK